jgi:dTDP-4-amino-4,6-dideoxygalactose transaminase
MKVPYRDLRVVDPVLKQELLSAVDRVFSHGWFILGPEHDQFEKDIANYCQTEFAIGVSSGTEALYLALRSLELDPGDEVILSPLSWVATLNAVVMCGLKPVFVDISDDLNINAELIEAAISSKTKVILPVHFTGQLCDMEKIAEIAEKYNLFVIEDAAQAFGAQSGGKIAGAFGHLGCFSLNPMKTLGACGEAGVILTNEKQLAEKLRILRYQGTVNKEDCLYPGTNGRLDTIQAAMLSIFLRYFPVRLERLQEIADLYTSNVQDVVICPQQKALSRHGFYSYTIRVEKRDELQSFLNEQGIETQIHHPILMPNLTAYRGLERPDFPVADKIVNQILSIPIHDNLTNNQVKYVIESIIKFTKN